MSFKINSVHILRYSKPIAGIDRIAAVCREELWRRLRPIFRHYFTCLKLLPLFYLVLACVGRAGKGRNQMRKPSAQSCGNWICAAWWGPPLAVGPGVQPVPRSLDALAESRLRHGGSHLVRNRPSDSSAPRHGDLVGGACTPARRLARLPAFLRAARGSMWCGSDTWRGRPASKCAWRAGEGKKAGSRAKRARPLPKTKDVALATNQQ
ncbi:hypothetical protein OYT1_ch2243 [Ferriphaselus amnicola]|uniref:Uncharacterized protein n=1 Tax=Ferriphaselus amnicola TaxID=1188319 RepID=A0A2Z6GEA2_9PROT|nr:hypothetical protein OYT1_ch2243 [Ferriphaselus amnicola]